jgi:PAS domain S-box-containing protein
VVNRAACDLTGYSKDKLLKMRIPDLHEEVDLAAYKQFRDRILKGESILSEAKIKRKDGTKVDTEFSNSRVVIGGIPFMHAVARDITERNRAEKTLRASEERYRRLFEGDLAGVYFSTPSGKLISCNAAFARIFRFKSVDDALATDTHELYSNPEARQLFLQSVRQNRRLELQESWLKRRDGTDMHVIENVRGVFDDQGELIEIQGYLLDDTERKKTEETLGLLAHTIRSISECVSVTDSDNRILFVNEAFLKTYGYSADELIGKSIELVRSESSEPAMDKIQSTTLERGWKGELVNRRKDGSKFPIFLSTSVVRNEKGMPVALVGIVTDITERKRAEESVWDSEERFRMVFENVLDGISIYEENPDSSKRKLVECNDRYAVMAGRSREELLKRGIMHGLHRTLEDATNKNRLESLVNGRTYRGSFTWIRPDGKDNIIEYVGVPITWRGKSYSIGIDRDITERKKSELELRSSHAQLHALAAHLQSVREDDRTNLAREMHDELGQLLTGLKMELSFLDKTPTNQDSIRLQELRTAKVDSMNKLIDKAIEAVRGISLELRPAILDSLGLSAALEWLANDFQQKSGIDCSCSIKTNAVFDSQCSTAMFRITQEALTNILRHSEAKKASITFASEPNEVILSVRDNGIGMEAKRIGDVRSLGLLGIRERAAAIGGTIEIDSKVGKGTTVLLRIPLSDRKDSARRSPDA